MKSAIKNKGFSLIELLVALGIIAVLIGLALPAINAMQKSYDSTGAESMINAALATARTLAISKQQYAGVRFQKAYNVNGPLKADQYMIFIVNKELGNLDEGFCAIEGYKPMKLPDNMGVVDMFVRTDHRDDQYGPMSENANEVPVIENDLNNLSVTMTDISAFSIVFSPAGRLVIHDVRVRNQKGTYRPTTLANSDYDQVFNSPDNMDANDVGLFVQDDYAEDGLGGEKSRSSFYIYDKEKFEKMTDTTQRWNYLSELKALFINAYTGEIIK